MARGSLRQELGCERASEAPLSHQERAGRRSPYTNGVHDPGACRVREAEDVQGDGVSNVPHGVANGVLPENGGPLLQAWGFYAPDLLRREVAYCSTGKIVVHFSSTRAKKTWDCFELLKQHKHLARIELNTG